MLKIKETIDKVKLAWETWGVLARMDLANYHEKQGTLKWAVYIKRRNNRDIREQKKNWLRGTLVVSTGSLITWWNVGSPTGFKHHWRTGSAPFCHTGECEVVHYESGCRGITCRSGKHFYFGQPSGTCDSAWSCLLTFHLHFFLFSCLEHPFSNTHAHTNIVQINIISNKIKLASTGVKTFILLVNVHLI